MTDDDVTNANGRTQRRGLGLKIGLVGVGLAAGAIGATAIGASALDPSTSASTSGSATTTANSERPGTGGERHGSSPIRGDEKALPAALTATLKAAALKAVPGGTVYRVETDSGDAVYEAHMTKADGTEVTVKFDKDLKVTKIETGMGTGDPAPTR